MDDTRFGWVKVEVGFERVIDAALPAITTSYKYPIAVSPSQVEDTKTAILEDFYDYLWNSLNKAAGRAAK
jgi:hypothetical protein